MPLMPNYAYNVKMNFVSTRRGINWNLSTRRKNYMFMYADDLQMLSPPGRK